MRSIWICVVLVLREINTANITKPVKSVKLSELSKSSVGDLVGSNQPALSGEHQLSSLAFVFDVTGSMYDDLRQLREGAHLILDAIVESPSTQISNFVLVPFGDPEYGPATVTEDREQFKEALNKLELGGGGDCPEMSLSGITEALRVSLPMSYVYVFTDASSTDHFIVGGVLDVIQRKQSQVVFVLTGDCGDRDKPSFQAYNQIAAASSGQVFNLQKTNVHKVLQFVKNSVAGRRVNLGSVTNPAGYNYTQEVPVDTSLGEVTVSVSGAHPLIKVVDPRGEEVTGPPKLVKSLDLDAIMVVNLVNPEPGNWSITVGSQEQHSVKVTGLSDLSFQHGFSVHPPSSARETSHRPLQGAENYLTITSSNSNGAIDIKYAEVVTTDGKLLFELPLKLLDANETVFLAGPFLPPDSFFYIAVNGVDENKDNVRRIGATAIQPQLPDVPFLTVKPQVTGRLHETVVLRCDVESLVPVNVQWYRDNRRLQDKITSLQSTTAEYVIADMSLLHEGSYKCVASNVAGYSKSTTNVTFFAEPPVVELLPLNVTLPPHGSLHVTCSVYSQTPLTHFQLTVTSNEGFRVISDNAVKTSEVYQHTHRIANITANDSGKYVCRAKNQGGESIQSSNIKILNPLKAIVENNHIATPLLSSVNLTCRIDNGESVQWLDPSGAVRTKTEGIGIAEYDSVYILHDVGLEDDGVWTCLTARGDENATANVAIQVTIAPDVSMGSPESILVRYGEEVSIGCKVKAKPTPRITWNNDNGEIIPANVSGAQETNEYTSSILIKNATKISEGTYSCEAENAAGVDAGNVTLYTWLKQTVVEVSPDAQVEIFSNAQLVCQVKSHPPSLIQWYHNGTQLYSDTREQYEKNIHNIYSMDFSKTGLYACVASNKYERNTYNVTIGIGGLEVPEIDKFTPTIVSKEGEAVQIPCRILKGKPLPQITWMYSPNGTDFVDVQHISDNTTDVLNLTDIRLSQNGTYRCVTENLMGTDVFNVALVVQFPPRLEGASEEPTSEPMQVSAGSRVVLRCWAFGEPRPFLVWSKDGMPVPYSDNVYLDDEGSVVVDAATEYDAGIFTCKATSILGETQKNFTIAVLVPPTIAEGALNPEIETVEGELVALPCPAEGSPRPHVEWTHNNRTVLAGDRRQVDEHFTLRFVANLTDFGEYTCIAVNKAGEACHTYSLFIWATPYVDLPYETVESRLGETVVLTCDAIGFPVPAISWFFGGSRLIGNTSIMSYNDSGFLSISSVSSEHDGSFVCSAENRAGVAQKYVRLNVNEPPHIIANRTLFVGLSSDAEMNIPCVAIGKPDPVIAWIKNGAYLVLDGRYETKGDGSLNIKVATEDVSGNYTCEASNSAGRDRKTFSVQLYYAPKPMQMEGAETVVKMVEGTSETLRCNVKHSKGETVKWYKEGKYLTSGQLIFSNVSRDNASTYACVVSNLVGSASSVVSVRVEWAPRVVGPGSQSGVEVVEVVEGDDYYLNCESDARPKGETKWFLDAMPHPNDGTDVLELRNMKRHHAGIYLCVITNEHGIAKRAFVVSVLVPPTIRDEREVEIDFREGSFATLQCGAQGAPKPDVIWHYNNSDWLAQSSSLTCKNITQHSAGVFRCVASNKAGVSTLVYRVNVVSPAKIKEIIIYIDGEPSTVVDKVEVEENSSVRISCNSEGTSLPEVHWIRNGQTLSTNVPQVYYADLTLVNVQKSDKGIYICVVSNDAGRQETIIRLEVLTKPQIFKNIFTSPNNTELETVEALQGQPFRLHCHPYGDPPPSIYWFKDGRLLRFYDDTMLTEDFGEVLVAKESKYEQSGNYTCVARNTVGEDRIHYVLNVLVPPISELKDNSSIKLRSKQGLDVNLVCPFQGNPPPNILWLRHPYTEINMKMFPKIQLTEDNSTMVIMNATTSDSGKFACVVTNKVGTLEVTFEVIIERAPVIKSNGPTPQDNIESLVVPLRRSALLRCEVDGFPKPVITWWKDTIVLNRNQSRVQSSLDGAVLSLSELSPRDAGQYICVADNSAGSSHRRYNVRVRVPGEWSKWSGWSLCNATCGRGAQTRGRVCQYLGEDNLRVVSADGTEESSEPRGSVAGVLLDETACQGPVSHSRPCHMPPCEEEEPGQACLWSEWSAWSECGATCGAGSQARSRYCYCAESGACAGDNVQIRKCPNLPKCKPINAMTLETASDIYRQQHYLPEVTFEMRPESMSPHEAPAGVDRGRAGAGVGPEHNTQYATEVGTRALGSDRNNVSGPFQSEGKDDVQATEKCSEGFLVDSGTGLCEDVDECLIESNMCHSTQLCENFPGGYRCFCQPGYTSLGPGQRCLDINECELELHLCSYACVNMAGGYVCACPRHLRLHSDRHSCLAPPSRPAVSESDADGVEFVPRGRPAAARDLSRDRLREEQYDEYSDIN